MVQSGNRMGLRCGMCLYTVRASGWGDDAKQAYIGTDCRGYWVLGVNVVFTICSEGKMCRLHHQGLWFGKCHQTG